jgi:ADP-heptose:LPS heptosyltransferase
MENPIEAQRILLIRLGGFGDIIFTLPAVHVLHTAFPQAKLSFLVYKEFSSLLEGFPGIEKIIPLDRSKFRSRNPITVCAETLCLLRPLVCSRFNLVVDFQGFGETALLTRLTDAPSRWGGVYRPGRSWAYTRPVSRNHKLHPVDFQLQVLRDAGDLWCLSAPAIFNRFSLPEATVADAHRFFLEHNLRPDRPTLFIQPLSGGSHKNWPLAHYFATARHWRQRGLQVLFGGGPSEQAALEPAREAGFPVAAGSSAILTAGLLKLSTLVLGGDTGPIHLAVAIGTRVLMITHAAHRGSSLPFGHPDWTIFPTDGSPVSSITLNAVIDACARALVELDAFKV